MLCNVHEFAPAKLNIGLKVLRKRDDGYHDIESIFHKISLCDELTVSKSDSSGCSVSVEGMLLPDDNTITKAYRCFCQVANIQESVSVLLKKNIPSGAGLGGGSSDAAAMIRALEKLFSFTVPDSELLKIAVSIGCDVPFFLGSSSAVVSGRGEFVRPIKGRGDLFFVVVYPDVHSSTPKAYGLVDEWYEKNLVNEVDYLSLDLLEEAFMQPVSQWNFRNTFTDPLVNCFPLIGKALGDVDSFGAEYSAMSGSGSAVYGIFTSLDLAKSAYNRLSKYWNYCYLCSSF